MIDDQNVRIDSAAGDGDDAAGDGDDARLLARLGAEFLRLDPPPELASELGRSVFSLRRVDDELAALVADSLTGASPVRSTATATRLLSFESPRLTVEIQLSVEDMRRSVLGEIVREGGAAPTEVALDTPEGAWSVAAVDDDRFEFSDLPETPVRFRVSVPGAPTVTTSWIVL